jgi:hypothetical protein
MKAHLLQQRRPDSVIVGRPVGSVDFSNIRSIIQVILFSSKNCSLDQYLLRARYPDFEPMAIRPIGIVISSSGPRSGDASVSALI